MIVIRMADENDDAIRVHEGDDDVIRVHDRGDGVIRIADKDDPGVERRSGRSDGESSLGGEGGSVPLGREYAARGRRPRRPQGRGRRASSDVRTPEITVAPRFHARTSDDVSSAPSPRGMLPPLPPGTIPQS